MLAVTSPGLVQLLHENKTWGRALEFIKHENACLKDRLSEVLDTSTDKDFLARAEQFQNKFILKDVYIDELRHDINRQEEAINCNKDGSPNSKLIKRHEKVRKEMEFFESDFNKLKHDFNNYLSTLV